MFIQKKEIFWKLLCETDIHLIFLEEFDFLKDQKKRQHFFNFLKMAQPTDMGMYLAYLVYFEFHSGYPNSSSFPHPIEFNKQKINKIKKTLRFSTTDINTAWAYVASPLFKIIRKSKLNIPRKYPLAYFLADIPTSRIQGHVHFLGEIYCYQNNKILSTVKNIIQKKIVEIQKENLPLRMNQLAIRGNDLKNLGYQSTAIGNQLKRLHKMVIRHPKLNEKTKLLRLSQ